MNAKSITLVTLLSPAIFVSAAPLFPFLGWQRVKEQSPDIIISRCIKAPDEPSRHSFSFFVHPQLNAGM